MSEGAIVFNASLDSSLSPRAEVIAKVVTQQGNSAPLVIRQSGNGNLWSASTFVANTRHVYNATGQRVASRKFPTSFRLMFAKDTTAIGDILDQDDAPQLMTMRFRKPPAVATSPSKAAATQSISKEPSATQLALRQLLRKMVIQQERTDRPALWALDLPS